MRILPDCTTNRDLTLTTELMIRKVKLEERIDSLQGHIVNLSLIGGDGRMMLVEQFAEKVEKLKQRLYEINLQLGDL